jgi:nitroimidazol reductase NimA-like FMN-containing flavoprotein (pyridoxamine 5'-phosphate oxidase superfamily)
MILEKIKALLKKRNFLSIATADKQGEPHAAPKFFFKIDDAGSLYLIDYAIAKTVDNLRINPRASMSFMDLDSLEGYRMSGPATLVEEGAEYEKILQEFDKKLIRLSADRLIEGMKSGKPNEHFELEIPSKVIIIKVKLEEIVRISRQGELFKEK